MWILYLLLFLSDGTATPEAQGAYRSLAQCRTRIYAYDPGTAYCEFRPSS